MKFTLMKSSDWDFEETVEINTLEDLKELQDKYKIPDNTETWKNPSLIINFNTHIIEIYDYYRE